MSLLALSWLAGYQQQAHGYQFVDNNLVRYATDLVQHRLRQADAAGTGTYAPVRTVRVASPAGFVAQAYPSPANPAETVALLVRIPSAGPATWELFDAVGRAIVQSPPTQQWAEPPCRCPSLGGQLPVCARAPGCPASSSQARSPLG